jgi:predicted helicase
MSKISEMKKGFIYVRTNEYFQTYNILKLGKTSSLIDRESSYITSEIKRGYFILAYEIDISKISIVEKILQNELLHYNIYFDSGKEFFHIDILNLIEPTLIKFNIEFKKLDKDEIYNLLRNERIKRLFKVISKRKLINYLIDNKPIISIKISPNEHQSEILNQIENFYKENDIGKISWACGLGKALLSIMIVEKLKFKNIVIGVPRKCLQDQIIKEILRVFPNKDNILKINGDEKDINKKIETLYFKCGVKFFITTYSSCHILSSLNSQKFIFDFKIGDEAHHLVGEIKRNEKKENKFLKLFQEFHNILSKKSLFMTATEKIIIDDKEVYSMEDEKYFGKYIDIKTIHWAIENKKITDYKILVLKNTEDEVDNIIQSLNIKVSNKNLFMAAYMTLKAIEKYKNETSQLTHILVYTNNTDNANLIDIYINKILSKKVINVENIYHKSLHSNSKCNLQEEIENFKTSKFGIISCVQIFGEGFDLPKLNGVCFAENMVSDVRIIQSILRPNRLEKNNPNKLAYIIIPYIDTEDFEVEGNSFEKCRLLISKIRNEDKNIEQKIFLSNLTYNSIKENKDKKENIEEFSLYENIEELEKIKFRLRMSKSLKSSLNEEQEEYEYNKLLIKNLKLKSKEEYNSISDKNIIQNPEEYFKAKGVWISWYDFLSIDIKDYIQNKEDWIKFCKSIEVNSISDYKEKCKIYKQLPLNPGDFYKEFSNISNELNFHIDIL